MYYYYFRQREMLTFALSTPLHPPSHSLYFLLKDIQQISTKLLLSLDSKNPLKGIILTNIRWTLSIDYNKYPLKVIEVR